MPAVKDTLSKWKRVVQHPETALSRQSILIAVIATVIVLGSTFTMMFIDMILHPLLMSPDQSMFVGIGQLMLEGKKPYVDVFDINPPLIFYIHMIPAMVAEFFVIPAPLGFRLTILAICIASCAVSGWLLFRQKDHRESYLFAPLLIGFSMFTLFLFEQREEFGQREHVFILLFLPFFLLRWLRWNGRPTETVPSILIGLVAAIGLCFKPHYAAIAGFLEALWMLEKRRWRPLLSPEIVACIVVGLTYALCIALMPTDMKAGYFSFMVPIFVLGYEEYSVSVLFQLVGWWTIWKEKFMIAILVMAGAFGFSRYSTLLPPLTAFTMASLALYLVQRQAWLNHAIPFLAGSYLLIAIELGILFYIIRGAVSRIKFIDALVAILACSFAIHNVWIIEQENIAWDSQLKKIDLKQIGYRGSAPLDDVNELGTIILKYTNPGDKILFMTRSIGPGYPLILQLNRRPASRYLHCMLIPTLRFIRDQKPGRRQEALDLTTKVLKEYEEDISKNRPKLIFIQTVPVYHLIEEHNNFTSTVMLNYEFIGEFGEHRVYKRK